MGKEESPPEPQRMLNSMVEAGMEVATIKEARMEAAGIEEARLEEAR